MKRKRTTQWVFNVKVSPSKPLDFTPSKNRRFGVVPALALQGYYAAPVQRVLRKWKSRIPDACMEDYFRCVALAVLGKTDKIEMQVTSPSHLLFVWEIASALWKVVTNKEHPNYWLLTLPEISVAKNGQWLQWSEISTLIKKAGGPDFTALVLSQSASRLHFTAPV